MSQPANPDFESKVRQSFARQGAMSLIKAELAGVRHGQVEIKVPHWQGLEQQNGFIHGGVVGMVADSAAGYAAMSMVAPTASVLSVEYKLNFAAPARGSHLVARGRVIRPGRTLIVAAADVFSIEDGKEVLCAIMQQTIIVLPDKEEKASEKQ